MRRGINSKPKNEFDKFFQKKHNEVDAEFDRNNRSRIARGEPAISRQDFERQRKGK